MAEAGIFHEDERLELIEGEIVTMSPIGIRPVACVNDLNGFLHSIQMNGLSASNFSTTTG
jgi:hypothetical protein